MNEEEYIKSRVNDQINWYDKKSSRCQRWYKFLGITQIILSVLIPFLAGLITVEAINKFTLGLFGVIIAIVASILNLYKFQENWLQYRITSESLKREKFSFLTKSSIYNKEDRFNVLVERVENIISNENSNWFENIKRDKVITKEDKNN